MAKNYLKASAKEFKFDNGGSKMVLSILVSDLAKIANDKGYANIVISERQSPDQYGNTHSVYENDYKPGEKKETKKTPPMEKAKAELKKPKFKQEEEGDLPF